MTKADLIAVIADKLKFPWARAELLVDVVFGSMEQSMSRGEKIEIRGFGSFTVRQYRSYDGRNPRTGAIVPVKPKRLAFFKVGKEMRERVNEGRRSTGGPAAAEPDKVA
jgi:integration host factor subunit beta